jgi:chromosome segregation ATPase
MTSITFAIYQVYNVMSNGPKELLEGIKRKIKVIHYKNLELEKELSELKASLSSKVEENRKLAEEVNQRESEIETLKLAKAYQAGDSAESEAKSKINEMVKEIDRCIALLNN